MRNEVQPKANATHASVDAALKPATVQPPEGGAGASSVGAGAGGGSSLQSSRIAGFAKLNSRGRLLALVDRGLLEPDDLPLFLSNDGLPLEYAESFIENCIGGFLLPLGIATNFLVDGQEVLIPMAVEESSVVAAASHGAKLARSGGGFVSEPTRTVATCQVQLIAPPDVDVAMAFEAMKDDLVAISQSCHPKLVARGGGVVGLELRALSKPGYFVIHVHVDTREAMGANIVNTIAEELGRYVPTRLPVRVGLKILTNLTLERLTTVRCEVDPSALEMAGFRGDEAAHRIVEAWEFADLDPFRAATHNKGIMNGIDPVVIATGNDWRAVEAGCHAYAALRGSYKPLSSWRVNEQGRLEGTLVAPIAVGTVGGVTKLHPVVARAIALLGHPTSERLSAIMASVGLAQNLSALRALACEGIQRGHMALHDKNIEMMRRYDHVPPLAPVQTPVTYSSVERRGAPEGKV
jgi:hydroxymethylglutaryl-CoA reductase